MYIKDVLKIRFGYYSFEEYFYLFTEAVIYIDPGLIIDIVINNN